MSSNGTSVVYLCASWDPDFNGTLMPNMIFPGPIQLLMGVKLILYMIICLLLKQPSYF